MRRLLRFPALGLARLDAGEHVHLRSGSMTAPSSEASLAALGWIYLGAAGFALVVSLVSYQYVSPAVRWSTLGTAFSLGAILLLGRRRLPDTALDVALGIGAILVTIGLIARRDSALQSFPVFYIWAALAGAFLLSRGRALIQLVMIAAFDVVYLVVDRVDIHVGARQWLLTIGTAVLAAGFVGALRGRVERLITDLAETSKRDPRTGLLNAPGFEELLEKELERAQRSESKMAVVVLDLDNFKEVNDDLGHREANNRLQAVADVLERTKRRIDAVAQLSGQVFALILPETDEHGAYVLADRLRRAVRDAFIDDQRPITASLGVASFPKHGGTAEELHGSASRAVSVAKELGRDRSVIYNPEISANLRAGITRTGMQAEEHLAAVLVLAETLDMRDTSTARHSETVARYSRLIATELGMSPREIERVHLGGMLHDIGKIGISDTILQKPGSLNEAEWEEMRKHPELGSRILDGANLQDISAWVRAHHERPDGKGYPLGLSGQQIPLEAKILAVADSYEAMTADRVYRTQMSHEEARAELLRCCDTQFDRRVVHAFAHALEREKQTTAEPVA
ncbi:MAG TPA: diguanylate cyclase [Thermoleophilaceae bacterium]|nr:diguanylate cyclase [Thermoleophilaceae bacterium]